MLISYENEDLRTSCLLLRQGSVNSSFTNSEIKTIRSCIADLKSAPKLIDSPLNYSRDPKEGIVEFQVEQIKIVCEIITSYSCPTDGQIERIKILEIINTALQQDSKKRTNKKYNDS